MSASEAVTQSRETMFGRWLGRTWRALRLWSEDDFRRDGITLLATNLRGMLGFRALVGLALLGAQVAWLLWYRIDAPAAGYEMLQVIFGLGAIAAGASLYAGDQQDGTFELLWLATGSERALLRMKILSNMVALGLLMLPAVAVTAVYFQGAMNGMGAFASLAVGTLFVLSFMALVGTYFPAPWAGGLVGGALLLMVYYRFAGSTSLLYPFANPFQPGAAQSIGANRVLFAILSAILLRSAAKRLRRTF